MSEKVVTLRTAFFWQKRAETINKKAQQLQRDMIEALGVDHYLTDEGDNVVATSHDLCFALSRYPLPSDLPTPPNHRVNDGRE